MGYFSNGSEGCGFEELWCSRCVHGQWTRDEEAQGCPVWALHEFWNYEQFPEHKRAEVEKVVAEVKATALGTLIPRGSAGQECAMFVNAYEIQALPDPRQEDLF